MAAGKEIKSRVPAFAERLDHCEGEGFRKNPWRLKQTIAISRNSVNRVRVRPSHPEQNAAGKPPPTGNLNSPGDAAGRIEVPAIATIGIAGGGDEIAGIV